MAYEYSVESIRTKRASKGYWIGAGIGGGFFIACALLWLFAPPLGFFATVGTIAAMIVKFNAVSMLLTFLSCIVCFGLPLLCCFGQHLGFVGFGQHHSEDD